MHFRRRSARACLLLDSFTTQIDSPYASDDSRAELRLPRVRRSTSRKGDCWDSAVTESFFATPSRRAR